MSWSPAAGRPSLSSEGKREGKSLPQLHGSVSVCSQKLARGPVCDRMAKGRDHRTDFTGWRTVNLTR